MALSTQPYKGARDFYPEDKRLQKYMFGIWRKVAEKFGYEEYDAPILEPLDIYLAKTGDEIVNEQTYAFEDRGGRKVVIRPEMTPTVSRMVAARRQELAYPLRWYSIPNLWRYERPQRGRLREHWQLNVDIFGVEGTAAEQEIIMVADSIMQAYGAKRNTYTIRLNSRKLMDTLLHEYLGLTKTQSHSIAKLIDRMHKIDTDAFKAQANAILTISQHEQGVTAKLTELLKVTSCEALPEEVRSTPPVQRLRQLQESLTDVLITNAVFDITLMRGFDYYTDIVFEVFDTHPDNNRSMFGGGRYDGLISLFGVEPTPTVGFGMGDVTLENFLETHGLLPQLKSETEVYVVVIGPILAQAQPSLRKLRDMELNIAVDISDRKAEKQIKTAVKKGIRYVIFIGEEELESEQFVLKDVNSGEEQKHSLERIVSMVKDSRRVSTDVDA
jgi:histidyl-tRNA synthetase